MYLNKRNSPFMLPAWSAPASPFLSLPGSKQRQGREPALPVCSSPVKQHENTSSGALAAWGRAPSGQDHAPATSPCSHAQPQETHSSGEWPVPRTSSPLCKATMREHSLRDGAGPAASPACRLPGYRSSAHPRIITRTYW